MNPEFSPTTARGREQLCLALESGVAAKWLLFWGHTPSKDGSITKSCFSQWWDGHVFVENGVRYATAEHYMMAGKARLFDDPEALEKVLAAKTPALAKKLGRTVTGFDEERWLRARWEIVVQGNLLKFSQHEALKTFLLHTGDRVLVEASPFDPIWGIGMAATDARARNPAEWKGLNLLGFALMEVREKLQAEDAA
ncbi:MAG: NADAR family protein [Verrucomicrobiota bacterium]